MQLPLLALLALAPQSAPADLHLELPEGLEAALWAESPALFNPTAIDVDPRGRLWVAEAVNYRRWGGRNPGRSHPEGDRIVVLEDSDGDGSADRSTVFAQGPELVSPLGVLVLGEGRVLVSCSPSAILYVDEDGDLRADRHEVFLTGFGGPNHDHGLHSFTPGPDGRLYAAVGNAGPHLVTDRDGWTLRSGSIYVGGGEFTADNKPGLVSDDGRVWTGGLVISVRPDGGGLRVHAHNFRNDYEVSLDAFGNLFVSDNDDDGNRGCRTLWAMEGGNHGYFSADGSRYWSADRRPGQPIPRAHWHADDPGVAPPGTINGAGGPTGVAVYEGRMLADWVGGAVLNADAGAGVVHAHRPRPDGAGVELEPGWLVRGRRGDEERSARWFRPSDVCVAPDGAVFVADWYDPGVGGHLARDAEAYGRVLRIQPSDPARRTPDLPPRPDGLAGEELEQRLVQEFLGSPSPSVRHIARGALRLDDPEVRERVVLAVPDDADARTIARLAYSQAALLARDGETIAGMDAFFQFPSSWVRLAALRALEREGTLPFTLLQRLVTDPAPEVRREVLLFADRFQDEEGYLDLMVALAQEYDGRDRAYLEAFGLAARGREAEVFAALSAVMGDTPSRWDARFEGLAWRLHPASAVPALVARASDEGLGAEARRRAVDALAFTPDRSAAEATATLALTLDGEVGELARWWVRHRDANDWREYGIASQLSVGELGDAELAWESGVLREGERTVRLDLRGVERMWLVVTDGGDGNSCDWAAWVEPRFETEEGVLPIDGPSWVEASSEWGSVQAGKDCAGGELSVGGRAAGWGIGCHASSRIELTVPEEVTAFECRVGPEDGGTDQNGGASTSVEFQVWVLRERDRSGLVADRALAMDAGAPAGARAEAVARLAADPEGGLMLIRAAREGALGAELRGVAAETIFTNPDLSVRALASEVFERPGQEGLPSIPELLTLEGDPVRGRALYRSPRALCSTCHTHDGLGVDIGPDLTAIGGKYSRAELLDAILNPSAGIAFGYDSWMMQVRGEGFLTGFVLADGEDVVLKDTRGKRHVIAREDIEFRERQRLSVMPEGVALGVTPQELADLVAFLAEDREAEPVFGEEVVLFDGADLAAFDFHLPDGVTMEEVWSIEDGVLVCKGQPFGYLFTRERFRDFELELEWRFDPEKGAGNSGVLLRRNGPHEVWPRSIECQLMSRNAGDLWNIDEFGMLVDPGRTAGRRTVKRAPSSERPLGEWNHYRIRLDRGDLEVEVNGVVQNTARWCEEVAGEVCLQSEGAEIHFRDIRLRPIVGHR